MIHKNIDKEIRKVRPKLRKVSPLAYWTVLIMALFNLSFGATMILALDDNRYSAPLLIVNHILTFDFWGILFIALGVLKLYSLISNRWSLAKNTLLMGVMVKSAWAVALTIRALTSPGTFLLDILWITIALLQMFAYIYFMPPEVRRSNERQ